MGLTDFVKDIEKKIFGSEDEAPDKIMDSIEAEVPEGEGFGGQCPGWRGHPKR